MGSRESWDQPQRSQAEKRVQGNIGSTVGGLPFLEEENLVELIVDIAETSPLLSIRGTSFFALGLISSTIQGSEILEDLEWMATTSSMGDMTGLCIPQDITKFAGVSML